MVESTLETSEVVVGFPHQPSLFKRYGKTELLVGNRVYRLQVALKGQEPTQTHFTSFLSPCLSTVKEIRRDLGKFIEEVSDEEILAWIYELSQRVEDLDSDDTELEGDALLKQKKIWVRYQVDCELIETIYLGLAKGYGTFKKTMGDLSVSNNQELPVLETLLKRFKKKADDAESKITGGDASPMSSFVKASNTYTYTERGTF